MSLRSAQAAVLLAVLFSSIAYSQSNPVETEKKQLASLQKSYASAKAASLKKPKDAKLKKTYVAATVKYATTMMNAGTLPPKMKYPGALRLYREALKVDPTNKEAQTNKDLIEGIYKQMGRPIPK